MVVSGVFPKKMGASLGSIEWVLVGKSEEIVGSLARRPVIDRAELQGMGVVVPGEGCTKVSNEVGVNVDLPKEGNGVDNSVLDELVQLIEGRRVEMGPGVQ